MVFVWKYTVLNENGNTSDLTNLISLTMNDISRSNFGAHVLDNPTVLTHPWITLGQDTGSVPGYTGAEVPTTLNEWYDIFLFLENTYGSPYGLGPGSANSEVWSKLLVKYFDNEPIISLFNLNPTDVSGYKIPPDPLHLPAIALWKYSVLNENGNTSDFTNLISLTMNDISRSNFGAHVLDNPTVLM